MILEKVRLKGFISFIDEEVDLRGAHVALIFGANGQGKSALLEAVPFCFWGEGRGKTIAEYINDKCETLRVEVSFVMDDVRYKKIRQCGKGGGLNELYVDKNNTTLEDASWRLITDDSKRSTDEALSQILGLTYDIFANSVFFGQKEASSFIEGTASDRKELLCNLLGIQVYEDAEQVAKDRAKEIDSRIQTKSVVLSNKLETVKHKDEATLQLSAAKKKLAIVDTSLKELNEQLEKIRKTQEKLKIEAVSVEKTKEKIVELEASLKSAAAIKKQVEADIVKIDEELESVIDEGTEKVNDLKAIVESKDEILKQQTTVKESLKKIESEKSKIPALKDKLGVQRTAKEQLLQKKTEQKTKIKAIDEKQHKINKSGAICPVTDQPCDQLTDASKKAMLKDLDQQKKKLDDGLKQIDDDITVTQDLIVKIDGELEAVGKRVKSEVRLSAKLSTIESDLKRVEEAVVSLPETKKKYRLRVDTLTKTKEELDKRLVKATELYEQTTQKLSDAKENVAKDFEAELLKVSRQIKSINEDVVNLQDDKNTATMKIGESKKELEQIEQAEKDAAELQKVVDKLSEDLRVETELAAAFGKNGIQKDIIAVNVPLLEETANSLLARFTKSNEYGIKFDLDPKTQSGKLKKQGGLDIIVYRKGGEPRPLNMYSGGETVRIVFAILLSLSSLLTKRAGRRSQTLIIDERVAALDIEGINQFTEIVKFVSEKYKKIFVVSHISELNEAFTNVITVTKDGEEGSKVAYQFQE